MEGETALTREIKKLLASTAACLEKVQCVLASTATNGEITQCVQTTMKKVIIDLFKFQDEQAKLFFQEHPNVRERGILSEAEKKVKNVFLATMLVVSSVVYGQMQAVFCHLIGDDKIIMERVLSDATQALKIVPDSLEIFEYVIRKWCEFGLDQVEDANLILETVENHPRNPVLYSDFGCLNEWKSLSVEDLMSNVEFFKGMLKEVLNSRASSSHEKNTGGKTKGKAKGKAPFRKWENVRFKTYQKDGDSRIYTWALHY
ncbi:hypothetical protein ACHQM5_016329 [Ranunculus cassubicifolius]